jgi:biopolymer transport protein ExbD
MDLYRRRKIDAHIDMTPMIDTLLQLFLIFLLNASFAASSVRLDLPKAAADAKKKSEPISVSINAQRDLFLNDAAISKALLAERLGIIYQSLDERSVLLRADRTLPYSQVLELIVEIRRSGAERVLLEYEAGQP